MKKILMIGLIALLTLSACSPAKTGPDTPNNEVDHSQDALTFKAEYEEYNGQTNSNDKNYLEVNLPDENSFIYASYEEVMTLLEKGTGVIYFGFPTCPWCRNIVELLEETAKEDRVDTIYYFNAREYRDNKRLTEQGEIETVTEAKEGYAELLAALGDYASTYEGLGDESIKRLYFPTVVFVKNGEIIAFHEGTVDSQEDPYIAMSEEQRKELKKIYHDGFIRTFREVCDDKC